MLRDGEQESVRRIQTHQRQNMRDLTIRELSAPDGLILLPFCILVRQADVRQFARNPETATELTRNLKCCAGAPRKWTKQEK